MQNKFLIKYFLTTIIFTLFLFAFPSYAQFSTKVNLESGIHLSSQDSSNSQINSIHRIIGSFKYKFKNKNSTTLLSAKIRPEIFDRNINSIKFNPKGMFIYYSENIIWKSILSIQHNSYNLSAKNSYYNTFTFINGVEFYLYNKLPINVSLGYSYQNISFKNEVNSDFLFVNAILKKQTNNYLSYGYGIFIEKFTTESGLQKRELVIKSKGWKYGPQIKIHYLKNFIIDFEYKFLLENSNYITYPSYEHQVKMLTGMILGEKFSFFLLADFYIRRIKVNNNGRETNPILLLPTKNENQVSIKTAYRFYKNLSCYFKIGYFRENLFGNNFKHEGLNVLFGFELKN